MTLEQMLLIAIVIITTVLLFLLISQLRKQDVMSGRADEQARQFEILRTLVEQKVSQMLDSMTEFQNQLKINELESRENQSKKINDLQKELSGNFNEFKSGMGELLFKTNETNLKNQAESLKSLNQTLVDNSKQQNEQVAKSLKSYGDEFGKRVESLTDKTDLRLKEISGQVEKRLGQGFEDRKSVV